jgi:hypothetical protein
MLITTRIEVKLLLAGFEAFTIFVLSCMYSGSIIVIIILVAP